MPRVLAVIPARYGSVRFPGKPLAEICGKPMIQWVYESTLKCGKIDETVIATDDERIIHVAEKFGAKVVKTGQHHETGTDRVGEVAENRSDFEVYVNVQGDQPFVSASILDSLIDPFFQEDGPSMSTVGCPITDHHWKDVNSVKVICDRSMDAIYFSRASIPFRRKHVENLPVYHHMGLYAFSNSFLKQYVKFPATPLEQSEQLEQLRALENGTRIRVAVIDQPIIEVNTPEDLLVANEEMARRIHE